MRFDNFKDSAQSLSKNPLGIIALFIVLVYGMATLLLGITGKNFNEVERMVIVWFIILFPVLVLASFLWLVTKHNQKMYSPGDFKDESLFIEFCLGTVTERAHLIERFRDKRKQCQYEVENGDDERKKVLMDLTFMLDQEINEQVKYIDKLYKHVAVQSRKSFDYKHFVKYYGYENEPCIMLLDVVGFSEIVKSVGPKDAGSILADYQSIVSLTVLANHGSVISYYGDDHLLLFPTPLTAINTAIQLQKEVLRVDVSQLQSKNIQVRTIIGLPSELNEHKTNIEVLLKLLIPNEVGISSDLYDKMEDLNMDGFSMQESRKLTFKYFRVIQET